MLRIVVCCAVGVVLLMIPTVAVAVEGDGCQGIESWDCGSGAYVEVPAVLRDVVAIDAGDIFTVALRRNGQIVVWGNPPNDPMEVTGGPWTQPYLLPQEAQFHATAIAAGQEHGTILTADGTLFDWHQDVTPAHFEHPGDHSDVIALAAGGAGPVQDVWNGQPHYEFLLMLREGGTLSVLGDNVAGTVGNDDFSIQTLPNFAGPVRAIAAGRNHALALTGDGVVVGWGSDDHGETSIPPVLSNGGAIAIAAGKGHSLAVLSDGSVVAWGANDHGQCDVPLDLSGVVAIAGGEDHSLALRSDGTVVAWGSNAFGQCDVPPALGSVAALACGRWHSVVRRTDGTVAAWGDDRYGQCRLEPTVQEDLSDVRELAIGAEHRLVLAGDGRVVGWGEGQDGQAEVPAGLDAVTAIAAGYRHSLALEVGGAVMAWGDDSSGQCDVPVGMANAVAVEAGRRHSLAILVDGTVAAWGDDGSNQCAVPDGLADVVAIAAGEEHSLALRLDGTVEVWGGNALGQSDPPPGLANIRSIAAGRRHSLAVRTDGGVVAWGDDTWGQCEVPEGLPPVVSVRAGERYSLALASDGTIIVWGDCGARRPGPPFLNRFYAATAPTAIAHHVLVAAGPGQAMAIRDTCPRCSPGDFNRDDVVDGADLAFLFAVLGNVCVGDASDACVADLNHDGGVGIDDLSILLRYWGPCGFRALPGLHVAR